MQLVDVIEKENRALSVRDVALLLGVSPQQIYRMAARGDIPSFRVANSVRFDPHHIAAWLRRKYPVEVIKPVVRVANTA